MHSVMCLKMCMHVLIGSNIFVFLHFNFIILLFFVNFVDFLLESFDFIIDLCLGIYVINIPYSFSTGSSRSSKEDRAGMGLAVSYYKKMLTIRTRSNEIEIDS